MKKYKYILLDADDTLFDFKKCEHDALKNVLLNNNVEFSDDTIETYSKINDKYWKLYEKGQIKREDVLTSRFEEFLNVINLNISPIEINKQYGASLKETAFLLNGATDLLEYLSGKYSLYIITNGVAVSQRNRLEKSGIIKYFKELFISEEVGYQKPQKDFFNYVLKSINANPGECIIVGDSLSSDILGGINAGIDTIFVNIRNNSNPNNILYNYKVNNLLDIKNIL